MKQNEIQKSSVTLPQLRENLGEWSLSKTTSELNDLLSHFLLSLQSKHTRRNYENDLRTFFEFTSSLGIQIKDANDITEDLIHLWQRTLEQKHQVFEGTHNRVVLSTVKRKLSALCSFLNFAFKRGLLKTNLSKLIDRPTIRPDSKTNAFTQTEVEQILSEATRTLEVSKASEHRTHVSAALNFAVFFTLVSVGMRVEELCELRIADFEQTEDGSRLHMTAKGNEAHSPLIHDDTAQVIATYIAQFRAGAVKTDYLFVRAQNVRTPTKLSQKAVYDIVNKLAQSAGISKRVSPHSCRATLATLLHKGRVPIGQIQELLNHKQISTTAIYIKKARALEEAAATKIDILE